MITQDFIFYCERMMILRNEHESLELHEYLWIVSSRILELHEKQPTRLLLSCAGGFPDEQNSIKTNHNDDRVMEIVILVKRIL